MNLVGASEQMTEVLIMSDGTVYVHNLTPAMAVALSALNPQDARISARIPQPARDSLGDKSTIDTPPFLPL